MLVVAKHVLKICLYQKMLNSPLVGNLTSWAFDAHFLCFGRSFVVLFSFSFWLFSAVFAKCRRVGRKQTVWRYYGKRTPGGVPRSLFLMFIFLMFFCFFSRFLCFFCSVFFTALGAVFAPKPSKYWPTLREKQILVFALFGNIFDFERFFYDFAYVLGALFFRLWLPIWKFQGDPKIKYYRKTIAILRFHWELHLMLALI